MKPLQLLLTIVCLVATFIANAAEQSATKTNLVVTPSTNAELQLLQGTWEGADLGDAPPPKLDITWEGVNVGKQTSAQKITITIKGNSFRFYRDTNFWFDTTIDLPAGTNPKQLIATIKGGPPSQRDSIGKVVGAIYKIENGTLTIATGGSDSTPEGAPKSFEAPENSGMTRYQLRKAKPPEKCIQTAKTK